MSKYGKYFKNYLNEDGEGVPSTNTTNVVNPIIPIGSKLPDAKSYRNKNLKDDKKSIIKLREIVK